MKYLVALVCAGWLGGPVAAADWPQFRGLNGSGVAAAANLPASLDPQRNVAWKASLPGRGHSSAVVAGDRIFLTACSGGQGERLHFICLDANTGRQRWERQFWATGRTTTHDKITVAGPTAVTDGARVIALFSSNDLFCLDLEGNLLWLRGLMRDYPNASNGLGLSATPVLADGTFLAQIETDGDAFALGIDVATGLNRWKIRRPFRANWTSPLLFQGPGGQAVAALQSSAGVQAVEVGSGREVWNYSEGAATVASSVLRGNILYVPSSGITALAINEGGKQIWRAPQLRPSTASPTVMGERMYILNDGGILTCADLQEGRRLWQLRLKGPFTATPVATATHLYAVNEKGLVQVVDPSKPEGEVVSELDLNDTIIGTPSIAGDALYIRSDGRLWKIGHGPAKVL